MLSRATTSWALPAVNGLTTSTGLVGHSSCAVAGPAPPIAANTASQAKRIVDRNVIASHCDMNSARPPVVRF
jgi:hypothetical protein